MRHAFTPAALRALSEASGWASCADSDELHLPEVLLGLLAEPECRAALLLAPFAIDAATVRGQFPAMAPLEPPCPGREGRFSDQWQACLNAVEELLDEYPRPLELATEHLLLALSATENEVARWLSERGLDAEALLAEVHRLSGHQPGPLPLDIPEDDIPGDDATRPYRPAESRTAPERTHHGQTRMDAEQAHRGEPGSFAPGESLTEHEQMAVLRIIDAAANRAGEGLRVIEDYLRFTLDDRHLTGLCKSIRHELTAVLQAFPSARRHAARDTQSDVGTEVSLHAEQTRTHSGAVLAASFKRVEQALRSLEEYGKTLSVDAAAVLEQLRYRVYTLERVVDITRTAIDRLAAARLYVLVDGGPSETAFAQLAESLIDAGVSVLQLRDKRLSDRELLARGRLLCELTRNSGTLFVLNDRPDLAVLSQADGVHVGQEELTVKDARRILGPDRLIGVSTHSLAQAQAAVLAGADYIGVGPTFPSGTKSFAEFTGTELLRAVRTEIRLPAFAIGGITVDNLSEVLAAGFSRVAVSGAVTQASDPAAAARQLLEVLIAESP